VAPVYPDGPGGPDGPDGPDGPEGPDEPGVPGECGEDIWVIPSFKNFFRDLTHLYHELTDRLKECHAISYQKTKENFI